MCCLLQGLWSAELFLTELYCGSYAAGGDKKAYLQQMRT